MFLGTFLPSISLRAELKVGSTHLRSGITLSKRLFIARFSQIMLLSSQDVLAVSSFLWPTSSSKFACLRVHLSLQNSVLSEKAISCPCLTALKRSLTKARAASDLTALHSLVVNATVRDVLHFVACQRRNPVQPRTTELPEKPPRQSSLHTLLLSLHQPIFQVPRASMQECLYPVLGQVPAYCHALQEGKHLAFKLYADLALSTQI